MCAMGDWISGAASWEWYLSRARGLALEVDGLRFRTMSGVRAPEYIMSPVAKHIHVSLIFVCLFSLNDATQRGARCLKHRGYYLEIWAFNAAERISCVSPAVTGKRGDDEEGSDRYCIYTCVLVFESVDCAAELS